MKFLILLFVGLSFNSFSAVPTEEGLLKNLNNASVSSSQITLKAMVQSPNVLDGESAKPDFYKWVFSLDGANQIALFQVQYTNGQMLNTQIKDVKYIPDLLSAIKKDKIQERSMFYAVLAMLVSNYSTPMESFLETNGVQVKRNRNSLNEDKMRLLRAYRSYLANNKGKGDANSPLNPSDPAAKSKIQDLFRSNMLERSKNVELVKIEKEFLWKVDWKSVVGFFTNEERQLRALELSSGDNTFRLENSDYTLLNGVNELPRHISFKDSKGSAIKIQVLAHETKTTGKEKKLSERYEEAKKLVPANAGVGLNTLFY